MSEDTTDATRGDGAGGVRAAVVGGAGDGRPGALTPRRATTRVTQDDDARRMTWLLRSVACRVPHTPAVAPPLDGMIRLGDRDRASFVWFLPCVPDGPPTNHGLGVDREGGFWTVRAWAHGRAGVFDVDLRTREATADLIEQAARLVGIPLEPAGEACRACALVDLDPCYQGRCALPEKKDEVDA